MLPKTFFSHTGQCGLYRKISHRPFAFFTGHIDPDVNIISIAHFISFNLNDTKFTNCDASLITAHNFFLKMLKFTEKNICACVILGTLSVVSSLEHEEPDNTFVYLRYKYDH